jgi:hypothetical protein
MKRRPTLILGSVFIAALAYLLITSLMPYPETWDLVNSGMSRDETNTLLSPDTWQQENSAYMLEHRSGLRLWRIDVNFSQEMVSGVRLYHRDPHHELLDKIGRLWVSDLSRILDKILP